MRHRTLLSGLMISGVMGVGATSSVVAQSQPRLVDGQLTFPEDTPRYLTDVEREYLKRHPIEVPAAPRGPYTVPTGPVHCTAEYEPVEGILLSWKSFTSIIAQMARWITTDGNADVYIAIDGSSAAPCPVSIASSMRPSRRYTRADRMITS